MTAALTDYREMLSKQRPEATWKCWHNRYTLLAVVTGVTVSCLVIVSQYLQTATEAETHYVSGSELPSRNHVGHSTQPTSGRYSCMWYHGGTGNLLFQYASVFGLSRPHNASVILGETDELYKTFMMSSADVKRDRKICHTFVTVEESKCCLFDYNLTHTQPNNNYLYIKYLQSWKYFDNVSNELRAELTFRPFIKEAAAYIVGNYRYAYSLKSSAHVTMVGLHIRRGDIVGEVHRQLGFKAAPISYIHNAVDYILNKFGNVVFIVCSNDMEFSKDALNYRNITVEFIYVSSTIDLAILSQCDHVIITVGSFGWWAGYLSNGTVVYYKHPMTEGSTTRRLFKYEDYFLPDWIGLE